VEEENGIKQDCLSHDLTCNLLLEVLNVEFSVAKNVIMERLTELTLTSSATSWRMTKYGSLLSPPNINYRNCDW
jgi:hypothetical protein